MSPLSPLSSLLLLSSMGLAFPMSTNCSCDLELHAEYDSCYTQAVRQTLASFHINLSKGDPAANGPLTAPDVQWYIDGKLFIGRENFVSTLQETAESLSTGLQAKDYYQIVDGNVGATLFALYGNQTAPVGGVPVTPGARFNTITGEVFVFNENAENRELWTIDQLGRIVQQLSGQVEVPSIDSIPPLLPNPQTSPDYRNALRQNMAALHTNVNAGEPDENAAFATTDITVNNNGEESQGKEAFVELTAARRAGRGSFPQKIFHDDHILADGKLGVISSVWQAPQASTYDTIEPTTGAQIRIREMLWFEFDDSSLISKVTAVYDESSIASQLGKSCLYP